MKLKTKHLFQLTLLCMVLVGVFFIPQTIYAKDSDFVIENGVLTEYKGKGGKVIVPDGVIEIAYHAFGGIDETQITSIVIPASVKVMTFTATDTDIYMGEYTCFESKNLKSIIVSKNNPYYSSENGLLYNKKKSVLYRCPKGKKGNVKISSKTKTIAQGAFTNVSCKSITLDKKITKWKDDAYSYAYINDANHKLIIYCNKKSYCDKYIKSRNKKYNRKLIVKYLKNKSNKTK